MLRINNGASGFSKKGNEPEGKGQTHDYPNF